MSEHDDLLYLAHIDDAITRIERTASARGVSALHADEDLKDATLFRLQTLAESTQHLSREFKEAHPEIHWDRIAGFRNRVVHGYLDVRTDIVWAIVDNDLPKLASCIRSELSLRQGKRGVPDMIEIRDTDSTRNSQPTGPPRAPIISDPPGSSMPPLSRQPRAIHCANVVRSSEGALARQKTLVVTGEKRSGDDGTRTHDPLLAKYRDVNAVPTRTFPAHGRKLCAKLSGETKTL